MLMSQAASCDGIMYQITKGDCRSKSAKPTGIKKEKDIPGSPEN